MKYISILLISTISVYGNAQIITNNNKSDEAKIDLEHKEPQVKNDTEIYFGISPAYSYRTLSVNDGLFAQPLNYREDEVGKWTTGLNVGVRTKVSEHLKLEIGIGYSSNRESYDFKAIDSIFSYINTYRHISFPIRIAYTYGNDISFYGGVGVIPKAFLSMKNELTALDINGHKKTEETIEKDKFNSFLLDAVATIGTQVKLSENYGFYLMLEGRRQLNNNYISQSAYIRKPFSLGFNVGIEVYL